MIIRFDMNLYDLDSPGNGMIGYTPSGEEVWSHDDFIDDLNQWGVGFCMELTITGFTSDDLESGL